MSDEASMIPKKSVYAGLFFAALSGLMLEILLTRIFSVVTWYYFAFFAISVAMFGLTVGALVVYIFKRYFPDEKISSRLSLFSLLFAVTTDISLIIFLAIEFKPALSGAGLLNMILVYLLIAIPFVMVGVVFCLCITRFTESIGRIYAADLIGASIGAFLVFPVLNSIDAPSAVLLVGAVAALAALFFASDNKGSGIYKLSTVVFLLLAIFVLINTVYSPVRVGWVKYQQTNAETESWNTFSRIAVYPLKWVTRPYSWGLSGAYKQDQIIGERMLDMDGVSETVMTYYTGDPKQVEHLKYDVTSIAQYLRDDAKVFVIGVGGGRDILTTMVAFKQKEVVGAEINNRILEMTNDIYGDFTGHLDKMPGVTIINDEARNAITRMDEKFDIIQASCIATWSATSAGAFSLAENTLYTVEAWNIFFDHLKPGGLLAFNRWYALDYPAQLLRMASLASQTLKERGVEDPSKHIAIVRSGLVQVAVTPQGDPLYAMPAATILVGKDPFTLTDISRLREVSEELEFSIVYDPLGEREELFDNVIKGAGDEEFHKTTALDLRAPYDDRPFFFYMMGLKEAFFGKKFLEFQEQRFVMEGIMILMILLILSIVLCLLFIIVPLLLVRRRVPIPAGGALITLFFFASIGFGYILIEIGMLQRLIVYLGHPIYSITVVLFSMLFSSGVGSLVSARLIKQDRSAVKRVAAVLAVLLVSILIVIFLQPGILESKVSYGIVSRILLSLAFLLPLGFFMGMPFPIGMSLASGAYRSHTPWFWAVNGATSVVASVASVCISIAYGFTITLTVGFICYILASATLLLLYSRLRRS